MRPKVPTAPRRVAVIAGRQHGAINVHQLLEAGLSRETVARWASKGLLHREFRGVYRVGHRAPSTDARYMAAVLACGPQAALAGEAAAFAFGLLRGSAPPRPEVASPADRRVPGVVTHRVGSLDAADTILLRGIPTTTVARTLVDLAGRLDATRLGAVCHEAQVRYRVGARQVEASMARHPHPPGVARLRGIFAGDLAVTLSKLERDFLAVLRAERLPKPHTNRVAGGGYVDCRWPEHRLTVELDSYRYHHTRHAWERDRRREREARARGDEFRRYTYGDVVEDSGLMLAELQRLLPATAR